MEAATTVWACGVFEGGGAKGAAYAPALKALDDHGVKFCSVAGSSAGALTAAMIAAGCTPEELERYTLEALDILAPPRLKTLGTIGSAMRGLRLEPPRVRPIDKLEALLERVLRDKCGISLDRPDPVTFAELAEKDGSIELFIVAVDAVDRREYVFHHAIDPQQGVANAAVASAAIPVYFPPGQPTGGDKPYAAAILFDGGVWANFPTWVYKDASFRQHHIRSGAPLSPVSDRQVGTLEHPVILGLLLDENRDVRGSGGEAASEAPASPRDGPRSPMHPIARLILGAFLAFTSPVYLFALAYFMVTVGLTLGCMVAGGRYCDFRSWIAGEPGGVVFWGAPGDVVFWGALAALFYQAIFKRRKRSGVFISQFYGWAEVGGSLCALGLIVVANTVAGSEVREGASEIESPISAMESIGASPTVIASFALAIAAIVGVASLTVVAVLAPAAQGIGSKVMFILTSAGSARYWVGAADDDHVIRIPVKGLDTLSFAEARRFLQTHSSAVESEVDTQLDAIVAQVQARNADRTSEGSDS